MFVLAAPLKVAEPVVARSPAAKAARAKSEEIIIPVLRILTIRFVMIGRPKTSKDRDERAQ